MFTAFQTCMLKQQSKYPNNSNILPKASQQDLLTQDSCGDNNINNNISYITLSPGYNRYYPHPIYSQQAMVKLHGNGLGGSNITINENNNM